MLGHKSVSVFYVFVAITGVTAFCYFFGINGPFLLDDFSNFKRLEYVDGSLNGYLRAIFDNNGQVLNRPLSYASFLINVSDWPDNPAGFKWINLSLHLITGLALYQFLLLLPFANSSVKRINVIFIFGLWVLSPLSVSTVLYPVQRMTILASLFMVLSMVCYLKLRVANQNKIIAFWFLLTGLAASLAFLSKENGILVVPLIGLLELYLRSFSDQSNSPKWLERFVLLGVVAFVFLLLYLFYISINSFDGRAFGLSERVLIQGVILFEYIYLIIIPDISHMSLHHDSVGFNLQDKLKLGLLCWGLHFLIVTAAIYFWKKYKTISFGILFYYVGHLIESTFIPLELMFEHRNYLPSVGLYLAVGTIFSKWYAKFNPVTKWLRPVSFSMPLLIFAILLAYRSAIWDSHISIATKWAYFKKDSARAQYIFAIELENAGFDNMAFGNMLDAAKKFNRLGFHLHAWRLQCDVAGIVDELTFPRLEQVDKMEHSSEIALELKKLLARWERGECLPPGYTRNNVEEFLQSVMNMKLLDNRPRYKAQVLEYIGEFYRKLGDYNKTVKIWREMYNVQPTIDNAYRNIDFAIKFGVLEYAEEYLLKAKKLNESMPWLAEDHSVSLSEYEELIFGMRGGNDQP